MTKSVKSKISKNAKKAFLFLNYNFPFFEIFDFQDLDVFLNNDTRIHKYKNNYSIL